MVSTNNDFLLVVKFLRELCVVMTEGQGIEVAESAFFTVLHLASCLDSYSSKLDLSTPPWDQKSLTGDGGTKDESRAGRVPSMCCQSSIVSMPLSR